MRFTLEITDSSENTVHVVVIEFDGSHLISAIESSQFRSSWSIDKLGSHMVYELEKLSFAARIHVNEGSNLTVSKSVKKLLIGPKVNIKLATIATLDKFTWFFSKTVSKYKSTEVIDVVLVFDERCVRGTISLDDARKFAEASYSLAEYVGSLMRL